MKTSINYKFGSLFIILFVDLLFVYGLIPFLQINNLNQYYNMFGETQGLINNGILTLSYIYNYGIKLGAPLLQGLPFIYLSALISIVFRIGPYFSNIITGILFLLTAYYSMFYLLWKVGVNKYISVICSYLFLVLSINYGQAGYGAMMYGFILLPLFILVDYLFFDYLIKRDINKYIIFILCIAYLFEKSFLLFLDGYAFMISSLASLSIFIAFTIKLIKEDRFAFLSDKKYLIGISNFIIAYIVAIVLYKLYVPGSASYSVAPLDHFRASGIDLISLIIPSKGYYFLDLLGITRAWNGRAFYGDGGNVNYSYLGYTLLFMFIMSFIVKIKLQTYVKAILIAGLIAFILSLGPSLKFNNIKEDVQTKKTMEYSDYSMPESSATFNLHTGFLYQHIPGVNNVRAVYRWKLLFMFSLIMGTALFLTYLVDKKLYFIAFILIVLAAAELQPDLFGLHRHYVANYAQAEAFNVIVNSMGKYMKQHEKIFYLSDENDALANYISAKLNVSSYNVGGDKNITLSYKYWPASIRNMRKYKNVNENAFYAMSNGFLDKLIIPYFNLRWHSYYWPPSEEERIRIRRNKMSIFNTADKRFIYTENKWFGIAEIIPKYVSNKRQLKNRAVYEFIGNFNKAKKIGDARELSNPWGRRIAMVDIDETYETQKGIFCMPGTAIIYNNVIIPSADIYYESFIGFHSLASKWKVSDGIRMQVEIIDKDQRSEVILDKYVLPEDGFLKVKASLSKYAAKKVNIRFSVNNDPDKKANGDWVVWLEPMLTVKEKGGNK